jgi:hypothetical protein
MTARHPRSTSMGPFAWARTVAGILGIAIATASLPGFFGSPALAAGEAGDGSDWGPTGLLHTDSAVSLRWDDDGSNPDTSVVHRDGRQKLAHAGGATYDDIASSTLSQYFDYFGPNNGLGGLQVSVSQTRDLVNQTVSLDISGVKGGAPYGTYSPVYLQVFQCWGGLTPDGKPDPRAAEPDPATCQVGAGDAAANAGSFAVANSRYLKSDPLVPNGDWATYFNGDATSDVPFTAITGKKSGSTNALDNEFFNATTTNEISKIQVSASGTATRQFELQTSLESPGLGCGVRRGVTSTRDCWLVIVPRIDGVLQPNGPIAPSLWAQRMQVKLSFRDIVAGCPGGQVRTLMAGSELLSSSAASWVPGLCKAEDIALGYTQLGDQVARAQFDNGANAAVFTTLPTTADAVYVPTALAAPVVAYSLSYQPFCPARAEGYTEEQAKACGYDSLEALNADIARSGTLVRDLHLDARLVAKLLTQSYAYAIFDKQGFRRDGWMVDRPASLASDPEFIRLNPSLAHISVTDSNINALDHFILEALRSDAAGAVWDWILADPDARAFLNGCPDADGMVINPFYSTRTYVGCGDGVDTGALASQAAADRAATPTPSSYVDLPLSYPPDGSPYPLPGWQEADSDEFPPYTVVDFMPRIDSMPVAGRDVATGYLPRNSDMCLTVLDTSCQPAPGKWKDPKTRQLGDKLGVMAITDSATAARFQLPTALLCDSDGTHCVGADAASLRKAADRFVDSDDDGVLEPGAADYASGAYPLTVPVYAAVSTDLPAADQHNFADVLGYLVGTGQHPGFSPGDLPPGYAPLTKALLDDAKAGIVVLRDAEDPSPSPSPSPSHTSNPGGTTPDDPAPEPSPSPSTPVTIQTSEPTQFVTVAAGTETWPKLTLPLGLGIAFVAAAAGPLMRMRSRFKVGR